MIDSS
jgi:hypothetical protein